MNDLKNAAWRLLLLFLPAMAVLAYCVQPPNYSDIPDIEFISMSTDIMRQEKLGVDTLYITFSFTDGDGDLGSVNGEPNIFIFDGRDTFEKPAYQIPYIDQEGAGNGISGEIRIRLLSTCCIYPRSTGIPPCDTSKNAPQNLDTVFYWIYIRDQAGHNSDTIQTAPITLICRK